MDTPTISGGVSLYKLTPEISVSFWTATTAIVTIYLILDGFIGVWVVLLCLYGVVICWLCVYNICGLLCKGESGYKYIFCMVFILCLSWIYWKKGGIVWLFCWYIDDKYG